MNGMDELLLFLGSNPDEVIMMMSCYWELYLEFVVIERWKCLASFPGPRPASHRLHLRLTVLQAPGDCWVNASP